MGQNTVALVEELGKQLALRRFNNITELDTERTIFFDVLGMFMVRTFIPHRLTANNNFAGTCFLIICPQRHNIQVLTVAEMVQQSPLHFKIWQYQICTPLFQPATLGI